MSPCRYCPHHSRKTGILLRKRIISVPHNAAEIIHRTGLPADKLNQSGCQEAVGNYIRRRHLSLPRPIGNKDSCIACRKSAFVILNLMLLLGEMGFCRTQLRQCVYGGKQLVSPLSLSVFPLSTGLTICHCLWTLKAGKSMQLMLLKSIKCFKEIQNTLFHHVMKASFYYKCVYLLVLAYIFYNIQ